MMQLANPVPYLTHASLLFMGLFRDRRLAWELTKRDLVDRYAGQIGGTLWSLIQPIVTVTVFIVLFGMVFVPKVAAQAGGSQMVYLVSGLVPWLALSDALSRAPGIIVGNAALVKQVAFPLAVLPLKSLLPSFIILPVGHGLLLVYTLFETGGLPAGWALLPLCWAMLVLTALGMAYALSAIAVFFRDVGNILQLLLFLGLYLSPIFYRPESAPHALRLLIKANPFTYLILCFQDATSFGSIQHPLAWIAAFAVMTISLLVGARLFNGLQRYFGTYL